MTISDEKLERLSQAIARFCGEDAKRCVHGVVLDEAKTEFGQNMDDLMPVASLAKLPVVMAVLDRIASGKLERDLELDVSAFGATRYVSILRAFDSGSSLSILEACRLALMTSDNPLAVFLMERVSGGDVGEVMRRAGVSSGAVIRAGFTEAELGAANRANVMSARDVSAILEMIAFERGYRDVLLALENNLRNSRMPKRLPDEAVVAHKTGSLSGVVNDAGIVTMGSTRFILSFLTDGQTDPYQCEDDIARCTADVLAILSA